MTQCAQFASLLFVFLGVGTIPTPVLAERPYNWKSSPPPVEVFAPVFEKIWAAAAEPETFRSIKGNALFDRSGWSTTAALPGAKESECWLKKDEPNPNMPANVRSAEDRQGHYECSLNLKSADATNACTALARVLQSSARDWIVTPSAPKKPERSHVMFFKKGEFSQYADEFMFPGFVRYVALTVFPNQCSFDIFARWVPNFVEPIFAKVLDSGRYSKIPTAEASPVPSDGAATISISVVNSTAFAADTWFSGTEIRGKRILPGSVWDFRISPGHYKVLAQFLVTKAQFDSGIRRSSLTPAYGSQEFALGTQYTFRLTKPAIVSDGAIPQPAGSTDAADSRLVESADAEIAKAIGDLSRTGATPSVAGGPVHSTDAIDSEVMKIVNSGRYSQLPVPIISRYGNSDTTYIAISNDTKYSLVIFISGHTSQNYTIASGGSLDVTLVPGSYRIVGIVPSQDVIPFYGTSVYGGGSKYTYRFSIK